MMLLAQAYTQVLRQRDTGELKFLMGDVVHRLRVALIQVTNKILRDQNVDGSWNGLCEVTSYAILALTSTISVPYFAGFSYKIQASIEQAQRFLVTNHSRWEEPDKIWIEKVSYSSRNLSRAFCLASTKNFGLTPLYNGVNKESEPLSKVIKMAQFFANIPLFSQEPEWKLHASLVEADLFLPRLRAMRLDIFPRKDMAEDKYLEYIPFAWVGCKYLADIPESLDDHILWDMMLLSMLNYQVDEYMEAVIGVQYRDDLGSVRKTIKTLCEGEGQSSCVYYDHHMQSSINLDFVVLKHSSKESINNHNNTSDLEVKSVLSRYVDYILRHPKVKNSPSATQLRLRQELAAFLLAHITQIEDNARQTRHDSVQNSGCPTSITAPDRPYYNWVKTTSADHTSCPFSYTFFTCLISKEGTECFTTAKQKYLAQDLCRHLATMCRQYNDYGSVVRDREEGNLNSIDFAEFQGISESDESKKKTLLSLAEYERECLNLAAQRLKSEISSDLMRKMQLFIDVTDLFGQIYVARDIASRMK